MLTSPATADAHPSRNITLLMLILATLTITLTPVQTAIAQTPPPAANLTLFAQGTLSAYAFPASTNDVPFRTADFTLERHADRRWTLLLTNCLYRTNFLVHFPLLEPGNVAAVRYSSDGHYSSYVLTWDPEYRKASGAPAQYRTTYGTSHPQNMEPIEAAPWLMFCLTPDLLTNQNRAITAPVAASAADSGTRATNHLPNIFMTLAWPTNHIPCSLAWDAQKGYLRHAQLWKPGHGNIGMGKQGIVTVTLPAPYHTGYLGATHELLSETDAKNGVITPVTFRQTHYFVTPKPGINEIARPTITTIVIGTVTNLQSKPPRPE